LMSFLNNMIILKRYLLGTDTSPDWFNWIGYGNNLLYLILIVVFWFGTAFIMAYWVYRDLKKRNRQSNVYALLVFFTNFIGLFFYLFGRYNEKCLLEEEETCVEQEGIEYIEHYEKDLKEEVDREIDSTEI